MSKLAASPGGPETGQHARAAVVNRTHRIVRERAMALQTRKRTQRDLLLPCAICSVVLLMIAAAVWTLGDESLTGWEGTLWHRLTEMGADAGSTVSIVLVWFLPLSVLTAAAVMLRNTRLTGQGGEARR